MADPNQRYGERRYFLATKAGVIEQIIQTDETGFDGLEQFAPPGLVEVDHATHSQAQLGGKYIRKTKQLSVPPPVAEVHPPEVQVIRAPPPDFSKKVKPRDARKRGAGKRSAGRRSGASK